MKSTLGFALCLILIGLESAVVFSQVGADKKPTLPPPKKTTTKTTTPAKRATRSSRSQSRSISRQPSIPSFRPQNPKIELVPIPGGTFRMGSEDGVGLNDEHPQHPVNVKSFYMGKYEVTQGQYLAVMRNNPSSFTGCDKCPVESVTWSDAQEFIYTLNKLDAKYVYRLPTEAEWEYACRAETAGDYAGPVAVLAWYYDTSNKATHPVGTKDPNAFGLYDMHGNVSEWCEDWYHDSYDRAPLDGSAWASGGVQRYRVSRGGSWAVDEYFLRSALRNRDPPANRLSITGFRVVAVLRT